MTQRAAAVASRAIEIALRGEPFTADDVRRGVEDPPSRATVYRVLAQLQEDEWIEQRGNGWHPDVKAQMLGGGEKRDRGGFTIDVDDIL
jgi:hypothetical protein